MDELRMYLRIKKLTIAAAARELGVTRVWLNTVLTGRARASVELAIKIQSWSDGAVRAASILGV